MARLISFSLFVAGTIYTCIQLFAGGIFSDIRMKTEVVKQLKDITEKQEKRLLSLISEVAELSDNPRTIERTARVKLGLAKPTEIIYLFSD